MRRGPVTALALIALALSVGSGQGCAQGENGLCVTCDAGPPRGDNQIGPPDLATSDVPQPDAILLVDATADAPSFPDVPVVVTADMPSPATCGNGVIEPGEDCDDRNRVSGDGCSAFCKREVPCQGGTLREDTGACYVVVPQALPWADAERDCQERGGHLASLSDGAGDELVRALAGSNVVWVGLFLNGAPGVGAFRWVDGSAAPAGTPGWGPGQPNNGTGDERCGALAPGGWADDGCLNARPYVCQLTCGNGVIDPGEACDDGNRQSGDGCTRACNREAPCAAPNISDPVSGHCYETVSTLRTFAAAQADCMRSGAHLVTPQNAAEQALVEGLLASQLPNADVWHGLNGEAAPPDFAWVSGEPVTWTAWDQGEPNQPGVENCGAILKAVRHAGFGRWDNRSCAGTLGYVCELEAN